MKILFDSSYFMIYEFKKCSWLIENLKYLNWFCSFKTTKLNLLDYSFSDWLLQETTSYLYLPAYIIFSTTRSPMIKNFNVF